MREVDEDAALIAEPHEIATEVGQSMVEAERAEDDAVEEQPA